MRTWTATSGESRMNLFERHSNRNGSATSQVRASSQVRRPRALTPALTAVCIVLFLIPCLGIPSVALGRDSPLPAETLDRMYNPRRRGLRWSRSWRCGDSTSRGRDRLLRRNRPCRPRVESAGHTSDLVPHRFVNQTLYCHRRSSVGRGGAGRSRSADLDLSPRASRGPRATYGPPTSQPHVGSR